MKYKQQYLSAKYMSLLQRNPSRKIKQTYHKGKWGTNLYSSQLLFPKSFQRFDQSFSNTECLKKEKKKHGLSFRSWQTNHFSISNKKKKANKLWEKIKEKHTN